MSKPLKLAGRVSISRRSRGRGEDNIAISMTDETSNIQFVEMIVSLADFALLITGRGMIEGLMEVRGLDRVGWVAENKTELILFKYPFDLPRDQHKQVAAIALAPFEVDGWIGDPGDLFNSHRRSGDSYSVTFRRHVPPAEPGR